MMLPDYPLNPVKRYDIEATQGGGLDIQETPFGDWVKWEDVKPREERWMLPEIYSLNVGTDNKNTGESK